MCRCPETYIDGGHKACARCNFHWRLPKKPIQTEVLHVDQRG
jgi:hypothetical protein